MQSKISEQPNKDGIYTLRPNGHNGDVITAPVIDITSWNMALLPDRRKRHVENPIQFRAPFETAKISCLKNPLTPAQFLALHNAVAKDTGWIPLESNQRDWHKVIKHLVTYVLHDRDGLLGYAHIIKPSYSPKIKNPPEVRIEYFGLVSEHRHQGTGLGSAFMSQLIGLLDEDYRKARIVLDTNTEDRNAEGRLAKGFHQKMGFETMAEDEGEKMASRGWYAARRGRMTAMEHRLLPAVLAKLAPAP